MAVREAIKRREASGGLSKDADSVEVKLLETPTIYLFDLEPRGYMEGTQLGDKIKAFNESLAEALRQKSDEEVPHREMYTQTPAVHRYQEQFQTDPIKREDKECTASDWLLTDILQEVEDLVKSNIDEDEESQKKKMLEKLEKAALNTCRVLASNNFSKEQITFWKKHQPGRRISYKLELLWTLTPSGSLPVTDICLNPLNPKVMAAGYGGREGGGEVLVWSVKNPEGPERWVSTESGITGIQFSRTQPRLLAAVTRVGSLLLIDIAQQPPLLRHVNREKEPPFPEPLWSVCWYVYFDGVYESERLLTVGQSGELKLWDPIGGKQEKTMAELNLIASPDAELQVRCQEILGTILREECLEDPQDPGEHFLQVPYIGLSIVPSPLERPVVFVTTDTGAVIKVNTNRSVEGKGWFKLPYGHKLPVLGMQHSPFQPRVFLTYSSDGNIAIWIHGLGKPLLELATGYISLFGITSTEWSPSHSTVLASLTQEEICIWDLGRRADRPVSRITGKDFTTLTFSHRGTNLHVGCKDGRILVYRLSEMPHMPHMQREYLEKALRKAVENKSELLKGLEMYLKA